MQRPCPLLPCSVAAAAPFLQTRPLPPHLVASHQRQAKDRVFGGASWISAETRAHGSASARVSFFLFAPGLQSERLSATASDCHGISFLIHVWADCWSRPSRAVPKELMFCAVLCSHIPEHHKSSSFPRWPGRRSASSPPLAPTGAQPHGGWLPCPAAGGQASLVMLLVALQSLI